MAYKVLFFGTDDLFGKLKPFYDREVERGTLEIVGYALLENGKVTIVDSASKRGGVEQSVIFELAIISSQNDFYRRMKFLEAQGIPRNRIIDGKVFKVPNLDFHRFLKEGVAYGVFDKNLFVANSYTIYPRAYRIKGINSVIMLERKSYIEHGLVTGSGLVTLGKYSSVSWETIFRLGENGEHNYKNVGTYTHLDWQFPASFSPPQGTCKILIGSDVWIGRGCILKCTNPNKPLIIGDGAVIAADSVVVKNIPPYAIVGGNPAQIIKYRFPPHVIESFLRIKWWDWSLDKIHDNFKYFNDVEKFISLHDK